MPRPTPNTEHPPKWALVLRREMLMAIGEQLPIESKLPQELPANLISKDKAQDPYADIVGTC